MSVHRCPECGQRLQTNYCDICMRKVPFAGARPRRERDPWDYSSAHREETGHKCITFDAPMTSAPKQTFTKSKTTFSKPITAFPKRKSTKKTNPKTATVVAVVLALLSFLPTVFSIFEDAHIDNPAPEYNAEAFAPEADLPVLQPTGIYSDGEIEIFADSLGLYYDEPALSFIIENNSDKDIDMVVEQVAVNGYLLGYGMSAIVDAGDSCQAFLSLYQHELGKADIETIARVDLRLRIYDRYDYDEIGYVEMVTIETEAAQTYTQSVDRSGLELYHDGSVCVLARSFSLSGYGDGEMEVYIENQSGSDAMVTVTGVFLNGQEATGYMAITLPPGTRTIDGLYLYELEELDIQELAQIGEVTVDLLVEYMDGWDVVESYSSSAAFVPGDIY